MIGIIIIIIGVIIFLGMIALAIITKEDWLIGIGIFTFLISLTIGGGIISSNNDARASEVANQYCMSKGYDTYDTFNREAFSDKPLGIKCNHINNKKEVIGADTIVAIQ